jgi:hypothetical protein
MWNPGAWVNPGSVEPDPCNHLPRLTGVWTVADTHTGMVWHDMVWYGLGLNASSSSAEETGRRARAGGADRPREAGA